MIPLTIIISAYNRERELSTLLESMKQLDCTQNVDLVISIDNKGTDKVNALAHEFSWHLGKKNVVIHDNKLGLINHFIWIGDQTETYEHVLFLEDDMFVAPPMLEYALQLIKKYGEDDRIAGCSLYNPQFCLSGIVFDKINDGYDNFFYQHPYWGNIWFKEKWRSFKKYLETYELKLELLPLTVQTWHSGSFKRIYIQFLIEANKTIAYPKISLLTNMGAPGLHCSSEIEFVQVPIEINKQAKQYNLSSLDESLCVYNAYEEYDVKLLKKMVPSLRTYDFVLDTKLNRAVYETEYVLTTREVKKAILKYSSSMKPFESNVIYNVSGEGLSLSKKEDVVVDKEYEIRLKLRNLHSHFAFDLKSLSKYEIIETIKEYGKKILRK